MNHLIVTADDFGLATAVNEAVEQAFGEGVLSAASLMVSGPAAAEAIRIARKLPNLRVGLHLVLVDGRPMLPPSRIPDLVTKNGRLRSDMVGLAVALAARKSVRRQLAEEIECQMAAFEALGLPLDHVNAHKNFQVHPIVAETVTAVGARYGVRGLRVPSEPAAVLRRAEPATRPGANAALAPWLAHLRRRVGRAGWFAPDAVFGLRWSGAMTARRLAGLIEHLPDGTTEIYGHPATRDSFTGCAAGYRYRDELAAFADPAVRDALERRGHRLGGYADTANEQAAAAAERNLVPA